jgi:predicted DNA-binding transcriptional regulator AlpA
VVEWSAVTELHGQIAAYLGVTRQRVDQLSRLEDFPQPRAELTGGIWEAADIEAWAKKTGRASAET